MKKDQEIRNLGNFKKHAILFLVMGFYIVSVFSFVKGFDSAYGLEIKRGDYIISRSKVERVVTQGDIFRDFIEIENFRDSRIEVSFKVSSDLEEVIESDIAGVTVEPKNKSKISFIVKGKEVKNYSGIIFLGKDINEEIPVNITVVDEILSSPIMIEIEMLKEKFLLDKYLEFKVNLHRLKEEELRNVSIKYYLIEGNNSYLLGSETLDLLSSMQLIKKFRFPEGLEPGEYVLETSLEYENLVLVNKTAFIVKRSFFKILILSSISACSFPVI